MTSSKYKKQQLKYLGQLLHYDPEKLLYLCDHLEEYYRSWEEVKTNPKNGQPKTYSDGTVKKRLIMPSLFELKTVQYKIKKHILSLVVYPENIHGSVKGKSNITNAKAHQGKRFKFCTDLQEFYPSVGNKQVMNMFLSLGYTKYVSHWLTKLCTIHGQLPQGTSTSPAIANIVFLETDKKLINLCKRNNITYTRYVDDLSFSSIKDFRKLTNDILDIVTGNGFKVSYRKTVYSGTQTITGIDVFDNYIDAPDRLLKKMELELNTSDSHKPITAYVRNIRKTNK